MIQCSKKWECVLLSQVAIEKILSFAINFAIKKCHLQLKIVANDTFSLQKIVANNNFSSNVTFLHHNI
jgi:hypothetical protein